MNHAGGIKNFKSKGFREVKPDGANRVTIIADRQIVAQNDLEITVPPRIFSACILTG